jgi:hypothetical protein
MFSHLLHDSDLLDEQAGALVSKPFPVPGDAQSLTWTAANNAVNRRKVRSIELPYVTKVPHSSSSSSSNDIQYVISAPQFSQ